MQKRYKYEKCKEFVQMQKKDSYLARFSFSEISEVAEEQSAKKTKDIRVEISDQMKENWQHWQQRNAKSEDDLIKLLSGIAKEHGLKKGVDEIIITGETYPQGIDKFEEYGMEEGCQFTIP